MVTPVGIHGRNGRNFWSQGDLHVDPKFMWVRLSQSLMEPLAAKLVMCTRHNHESAKHM